MTSAESLLMEGNIMDSQSECVAVFRHELFKHSETFIAEQAESVPGWRPFFIGRSRAADGKEAASFASWTDCANRPGLLHRIHQVATRSSRPYEAAIRSSGAKLIHAHFGVEGVYALPIAKALRLPLITTFHGFDATTSGRNLLFSGKPSWLNYLRHRSTLARRGDLFLCVSDHIRRKVVALGFPEHKTHTHYIGVDVDKFGFDRECQPGRQFILHVGRLVEKKGAVDLVRAFSKIADRFPEVDLKIVGVGPLESVIREQICRVGLSDRVRLLGALPHSEVRALMRRASLMCQPSVTARSGDTEGLPIVLMEAAASGVPVVSTFHAGIPELIEHGVTGLLSEEGDAEGLARHLVRMLENSGVRECFAVAARLTVERRFNIKCQSQKLGEIYGSLT